MSLFKFFTENGIELQGFSLALVYIFGLFILLDILTGLLAALYNKKIDSKVSYKGFVRKMGLIAGLALAFLIDVLLSDGVPIFTTGTLLYLSANEGISILENLSKMNIKLPLGLGDRLKQTIEHNNNVGKDKEDKK